MYGANNIIHPRVQKEFTITTKRDSKKEKDTLSILQQYAEIVPVLWRNQPGILWDCLRVRGWMDGWIYENING